MERNNKLGELEFRLDVLEGNVDNHAEQLTRIEKNTAELIETFQAFQGAWKVLNWIGKLAKPIAVISAMSAAVALYFKDHWK